MKLLQVNATLLNRVSSNNSCNKFTIRISEITLLSQFQLYYIILLNLLVVKTSR